MSDESSQATSSAPVEAEYLLRRLVDHIRDPHARRAIAVLALPHWFNDKVLTILAESDTELDFAHAANALERDALVERWADGSRAVLAPLRDLLRKSLWETEPTLFRQLSGVLADCFSRIGANDGDVFDHIEGVYHQLVSDPEESSGRLLADGITWKSEPLFAFDALERLITVSNELKESGMLPQRADHIVRLLELYLPARRKTAHEERQILGSILSNSVWQSDLFDAELKLRLGLSELLLGGVAKARSLLAQALQTFQRIGLRRGEADAARALGRAALKEDDLATAEQLFQCAERTFEELGLKLSASHCVKSLAETAFYQGRFSTAEELFNRALKGFSATEGHLGEANTRVVYAQLLAVRAQFEEAKRHIELASGIYKSIDQRLGLANCVKNTGNTLFEEARYQEAILAFADAADRYKQWGSASGQANCQLWIGACETRLGNPEVALAHLQKAEEEFDRVGDRFGHAGALREQGIAESNRGKVKAAINILEKAINEFRAVGNEVEAKAAAVALGRAAIAADYPSPYTPSVLKGIAFEAQRLFSDIRFKRHLRESEELAQALPRSAA